MFLAGAALFGALVMVVYGAVAGKGKGQKEAVVEEGLQGEVHGDVHNAVVKTEP